ncbi:MAG: TldD/PmbA family protein [Myxococcales bacterium]|nr:TldD/PmbA family protein [Myxococcales bacterium]
MTLASQVTEQAQKAGAELAEVLVRTSRNLSVKVRLGAPELVEEAGSSALGIRVLKNGRSATTSTSDLRPEGIEVMVRDAIDLAELSEPDPMLAPPPHSERETQPPNLDLYDKSLENFNGEMARNLALEAETTARNWDKRITNSEGASVSRTVGNTTFVTSDGFAHQFRSSYLSLVVQPLADDSDGKKRLGFHWDARRHQETLGHAATIGEEAARRTIAKLGAQKLSTEEMPVVFGPEAARALLGLLASCLNGASVYKRQSYLAEHEGERIASKNLQIVDDPLILRGPGSRPFDGEGLISRRNEVVKDGILQTFLLDTYSARRLGKISTGSAARSVGGRPTPAPSNLFISPGTASPEEIISEVSRGLYVTSMMGFGFNAVTGDFSRGAEGFLIENGHKTMPVSEVTIGLNFRELWRRIDAIGSDLDLKASIAAPTLRVTRMTVAGQ